MRNLKKGDLVLMTRVSEEDKGIPLFLENTWAIFKRFTKTGKLEVLAPSSKKGINTAIPEIEKAKARTIFSKNVRAVVRLEKNPHIEVDVQKI